MTQPQHLGYTDELLADGTVHRRYEDGRNEWRRRGEGRVVHWHDNQDRSGTDEPVGSDLVKRRYADGTVAYGRDIGYGRTVWAHGELVTVNRTSFRGRLGVVLGALGVAGAVAVTAAQLPPLELTEEEEEELNRQARSNQSDAGSGGGGDGGGSVGDDADYASDAEWDDSDAGWDGDDFG